MLERHDRNRVDPFQGIVFTTTAGVDSTAPERQFVAPKADYVRYKESLLTDNDGSPHDWKKCEHYKLAPVPDSGSNSVEVYLPYTNGWYAAHAVVKDPLILYPGGFGNAGEYSSSLVPFLLERADGGFVPPPAGLDSLLQHAIKAMMPGIKSELSVVNSLIELKDFLTLRSTLTSVKNTIGSLFKQGFGRKTLAEIFRTKADVYLQYKFNIAPLLSDIHGIYRAIANTEKRINALVTRSGRVRVSHYSRSLNESIDQVTTLADSGYTIPYHPYPEGQAGGTGYFQNSVGLTRSVVTEPASFHVQVQYNFNYTAYQVEHARILALLDAFGVNFNPAIIWNAIPWSFVVDWLVGIGPWLDSLKVSNMEPKINILRCLWSVKRKRRILVSGTNKPGDRVILPPTIPHSSLVLPTVVETAYRRDPFMPGSSLIESSGLTLTEFSLGAALVISRRRRPKRLRR
jgi:hypothetical protein